jgi:DNA repair exonuclease SbcCD ATPase subunit
VATEVIYARVPMALKEAADAYASQRGKTLTGAVVDLLDRGLSAVSDERSVGELKANLARVTAEKGQADAELHTARTQLATLGSFAERAGQRVGACPGCGKPITGHDLLAVGQCPHCHQTLSSLIVPDSGTSTLDQRELLILVGALGAVLAVAYLSSKK